MLWWNGLLGSITASFVNVMVIRSRKKEDYLLSRSRCPECGHRLSLVDMLPIIGFVLRKGKCHYCGCLISKRYPLTEIIGFVLGIMSRNPWEFVMFMDLLAIALYDHDQMIIKDSYLVVLLVCGIFIVDLRYLNDHLMGSVIVSVPLMIMAILTKGFGMGDVKLMAVAGFILGWERCLLAFVVRCVLGSVVSLVLLWLHKAEIRDRMPFGPYLAAGIITGYVYGFRLIDFYESIWLKGV